MKIALVHDYLTQRGGAERVALTMARAFPDAPLHTAFYEPEHTYPEFGQVDVRPLPINRIGMLRRDHRIALPLLAASFGRLRIDADVVVCSSSGWAHGVVTEGRKIVYCHTPARWLYQTDRYMRQWSSFRRVGLEVLRNRLMAWDVAAAHSAARYLANSSIVRERIRDAYHLDADVLPPPHVIDVHGERQELNIQPGFYLCVSRLLTYRNVDAVTDAFTRLQDKRLVIAGTGPELERLRRIASPSTTILGEVSDPQLRWLYANCAGIVGAAYEDFGLIPLEAGAFGKPAVVLRYGGYLDTVRDGVNGLFFDEPVPDQIAEAVVRASKREWHGDTIRAHSAGFAPELFVERLRGIVESGR